MCNLNDEKKYADVYPEHRVLCDLIAYTIILGMLYFLFPTQFMNVVKGIVNLF